MEGNDHCKATEIYIRDGTVNKINWCWNIIYAIDGNCIKCVRLMLGLNHIKPTYWHFVVAIRQKRYEIIQLLLDSAPNLITRTDVAANTCLHIASFSRKLCAYFLKLAPATMINAVNNEKETPLYLAVHKHCNKKSAVLLILCGGHMGKLLETNWSQRFRNRVNTLKQTVRIVVGKNVVGNRDLSKLLGHYIWKMRGTLVKKYEEERC